MCKDDMFEFTKVEKTVHQFDPEHIHVYTVKDCGHMWTPHLRIGSEQSGCNLSSICPRFVTPKHSYLLSIV